MDIALLAAASDGSIVASEIEAVEKLAEGLLSVGNAMGPRLAAHVRVLITDPPKLSTSFKKLSMLPESARQRVSAAAAAAVLADGQVLPSEVRFLERLYAALGLPRDDVYGLDELPVSAPDPASLTLDALVTSSIGTRR